MKKLLILLNLCVLALSCQPHFDMVPPRSYAVVQGEFSDNLFVTLSGSGSKNGVDWENAMPFADLLESLKAGSLPLTDTGIHIQEGEYHVTDENEFIELKADIRCIRGGYSKSLKGKELGNSDPTKYPTIFTGKGAFAYVKEARVRFDNITFKGFRLSAASSAQMANRGSAVFTVNGPYLSTSVECLNCIFENNVNEVSGSTAAEGGPCAFVTQGYFKACDCKFLGNSASSRGGAIRTSGKQAVLMLDRCTLSGNKLTNDAYGSAIQCSAGVVCMNNSTLVGNMGNGSTLNGGGAFLVSNSTIIDGVANNAAFRCESPASARSVIVNSLLTSSDHDGIGIILKNNDGLISKGYNVIKTLSLAEGVSSPLLPTDTEFNNVLEGEYDGIVWRWDVSQAIDPDGDNFALLDDVYDAVYRFDPSEYCNISVLGRSFLMWLSAADLALDGRGKSRGEERLQPGSYDPNID